MHRTATLALLLSACMANPARAGTLVTSAAALGANDFVDWGAPEPKPFFYPATSTNGGVSVLAFDNTAGVTVYSQGVGWNGNFAPGAHVLSDNNDTALEIDFDSLSVRGVGFQVQARAPGPFTAQLSTYDFNDNPIGIYTLSGNSTAANDNSAIFIGALDTTADIRKLTINVGGGALAVGQLDFVNPNLPLATPEPGSLTLLGVGALGMAGYAWRRKRRAACTG
jgi:hypothetical protein